MRSENMLKTRKNCGRWTRWWRQFLDRKQFRVQFNTVFICIKKDSLMHVH